MSKILKIILGVAVLGALGYLGMSFLGGDKKTDGSLSVLSTVEETGAGGEVLATLNALNSVSFNIDFFADKAFEELMDFSVILSPGETGRENPFSPASGQGGSVILQSSGSGTTTGSRTNR